MKKIAAFILFIGVLDSISAQSTLTLDSCRALALSNNKELRISAEKITAAHYEKKAAFTNYLPKIAAIGAFVCPVLFSGAVELLQAFCTTYRGGDWLDFASKKPSMCRSAPWVVSWTPTWLRVSSRAAWPT